MQVCAIKFGPQKPSLESIHNGGSKNKPYDNVYYMLKELKYEKTQQEARTNTSRATGVVFSRGINALVYNTYDIRSPDKKRQFSAHYEHFEKAPQRGSN